MQACGHYFTHPRHNRLIADYAITGRAKDAASREEETWKNVSGEKLQVGDPYL